MTQCEHQFNLDLLDGQVKCVKCGDFDDEMQLVNKEEEHRDEKDEFDASQVSFE